MLNKHLKYSIYAATFLGIATACEPDIERETPVYEQARGNADFSTYVALGNSLTAGYADGALNREGQENSYPAIIAGQLAYISPDFAFEQPLLPAGRANGTIMLLGFTSNGLPILSQESGGLSSEEIFSPVQGSFNNMGVPGAKAGDLTRVGYGSVQGNPYFARFASAQGTTVVQDANAQNPTFFTLWIGNNDVLGYGLAGGDPDGVQITPAGDFQEAMEAIIDQLTANNPNIEGAVATIPDITKIPYFNTVPWNSLNISDEQAQQLNAGFAQSIEPEVRKQVIRGVIAEVARRQIIRAIVEEGARRQVISQVAPQVVYQQAYDQAYEGAIAQGASEEEAKTFATQQAEAYVASEEGQQAIQDLSTDLVENRQPEQVHAIVEQNLASEDVQNQINTTATAAYEDESLLGEEGVRNLHETLSSTEVQNQIEQNYQGALQADAAGQLEAALGAEGVAAVNYNLEVQIDSLKERGVYPSFQAGANGFVVASEQSPTGIYQLNEQSKVLFSALIDNVLSAEYLAANSFILPDRYALDHSELEEISNTIFNYNRIITQLAEENTFALVDMNGFFNQVANGYTEAGTTFSAAYITGNAFSLDGVHLTQKGYALVAKKFIGTINSYYGSQIPEPNIRPYPAVGLPH